MIIETPLLIIGHGPAALVAAKVLSGSGLTSLVAGHEPLDNTEPVELDAESLAILEPHGVLGVLRPYASTQEPFAIAPLLFEQGLKHHCVADMLITVYDDMAFTPTDHDRGSASGPAAGSGRLDGAGSSWEVKADALLDVSSYPTDLNQSIHQAAAFGVDLLAGIGSR
ncbi:MAG: hypothetical protein ACRBK7_02680 [Acidimicrobiales bacterium]